jgi:hypothetical protein
VTSQAVYITGTYLTLMYSIHVCADQKEEEIWVTHVSDGSLKLEQEIFLVPQLKMIMMTLKVVGLVTGQLGILNNKQFYSPSLAQIRNEVLKTSTTSDKNICAVITYFLH